MRQKFCAVCKAALSEGIKFCENCGTPVVPDISEPLLQPSASLGAGKVPVKIIAGIIIVLIIAAAVVLVVLPKMRFGSTQISPGMVSLNSTVISTTIFPITTIPTPVTPTPTPDPFPNALYLKEGFPFGKGEIASEGTVYRIWINGTYNWHNDMDNKYYIQKPKPGNKYLFVFINVFNKGNTRVWPPTSANINVYYNGQKYPADPTHYLPDKSSDREATGIEIKEIQYFSKFFGTEYVEDYGYSHGSQLAYLYPGKSNAIDGYIVYEVPESLTPENAYVEIVFNGNEVGVWTLI